jgi:dTDP-glucose 4,6-dehydratase
MNKTFERKILITGGAGFIGSHLVRRMVQAYPQYKIINLDALTYAGNLANLSDIEGADNYEFVRADIRDYAALREVFLSKGISDLIHLAAESHVDRSIEDPTSFVETNVMGTARLLMAALECWKADLPSHRFHHVSTDEVFGSLGSEGFFTETTPYSPRSPYSASKAGSDHLVRAFQHTYGLNAVVTNCSNNYGPNQFPEKLIPLIINNILHNRPLPVYGKGDNVRDWLWVGDHVSAIDLVFHRGAPGETYNIGGNTEMQNIDLVLLLCELMDQKLGRSPGSSSDLIRYVTDRPGHDHRYAIDAGKIGSELGWQPAMNLREGLQLTIDWYLSHGDWLQEVTSGAYMDYYKKHYTR